MRHNLEALEDRMLLSIALDQPHLRVGWKEVEPNDTIGTATPMWGIAIGMPCIAPLLGNFICPPDVFRSSGQLGGPSAADADIDYFTFATPAGARVSVHMEGAAVEQGATFDLVASDGTVLASSESHDRNGDGVTDGASLEYSTDTAAHLYIRVKSDGGVPTEGLGYHVAANVRVERIVEHEPNDTFDTANEIVLAWRSPEPITLAASALIRPLPGGLGFVRGELDNGSTSPDSDFFRFNIGPSLDINVRVTGLGAQAGHLSVYDTDRNVIAEVRPDFSGNLEVNFQSTSAGDYFAQLRGKGTIVCVTAPCLSYSLAVKAQLPFVDPFVETEPNNTIETADELQALPLLVAPILAQTSELSRATDPSSVAGSIICLSCPRGRGEFTTYLARGDFSAGSETEADKDYFSLDVAANRTIAVSLNGAVPTHLQLLDDMGNVLAEATTDPATPAVYDAVKYLVQSGGTFYLLIEPSGGSALADENSRYGVRVMVRHDASPIEGPGEQEPNDTDETANVLGLRVLPTLAPGIQLRGGTVHGVAGGPTADRDFYKFEVKAGERVNVQLHGLVRDAIPRPLDVWLRDHNLNEYGDPIGTVYRRGGPRLGGLTQLEYILARHPALRLGQFDVTVYDSAGNEVGTSGRTGTVSFNATADATYFALVKPRASASADYPGHYRLGVLARSRYVAPTPVNGAGAVIVLGARRMFTYTDSSGDRVQLSLAGRKGQATVTFSDSTPDGSDIASVEIVGVSKGGSFTVQTDGSAEVGSITIRASGTVNGRRGNVRSGNFDAVQVAGNVGIVSSQMNLNSLVVAGMLGDLTAPGSQVRQLRAAIFDSAMADVGSIRTMAIEKDTAQSLVEQFLPWEPLADSAN